MELANKIMAIYPTLDFSEFNNSIILQDDSDGKGAYIKEWNHPTLARPTETQLASV